MSRPAPFADDRQPILFDDLPVPPPRSSDRGARDELLAIVGELTAAAAPPWSLRLLGWQRRRFATLALKLTPLEAAALQARFDAELDRLGPPTD